jgi:hypothetical protein
MIWKGDTNEKSTGKINLQRQESIHFYSDYRSRFSPLRGDEGFRLREDRREMPLPGKIFMK